MQVAHLFMEKVENIFPKTTSPTYINVCCYKNEYGAYFKCLFRPIQFKKYWNSFLQYTGLMARPDMAYYKFCNLIKKNKTIKVFNKESIKEVLLLLMMQ